MKTKIKKYINFYELEKMVESAEALVTTTYGEGTIFMDRGIESHISTDLAKASKEGVAAINILMDKYVKRFEEKKVKVEEAKKFLRTAGPLLEEKNKELEIKLRQVKLDYEVSQLQIEQDFKKQLVNVDVPDKL